MGKFNWLIISTIMVDLGLLGTFISVDRAHIVLKISAFILFIIGFIGLLLIIKKNPISKKER